ncbi:MAG: head GIN domain-containing protein [Bacteroidota bacterium]
MKNSFFIIACVIFLFSCEKGYDGVCLKGTGDIITGERTMNHRFVNIDLDDNVELVIVQDTYQHIKVEAGENVNPGIVTETDTENGTLKIFNANACEFFRNYKHPLKVYVYTDTLNKVTFNGGGNISSQNTLTFSSLTFECLNSGSDVILNVDADSLKMYLHTGSTNVYVNGTASYAYFYSSGNSIIHAENLVANDVHVNNHSTGDFYVNAINTLRAEIFMYSTTWYKGNPVISRSGPGSGEIKPIP